MAILQQVPHNRGVECRWGMKKNYDFPPVSRIISEMIQEELVRNLSNDAISSALGWPSNLDFKGAILLNIKLLETGTR